MGRSNSRNHVVDGAATKVVNHLDRSDPNLVQMSHVREQRWIFGPDPRFVISLLWIREVHHSRIFSRRLCTRKTFERFSDNCFDCPNFLVRELSKLAVAAFFP